MSPCPPATVLRRLLDEQLLPAELPGVATHVAECPLCQAALDRLTNPGVVAPLTNTTSQDLTLPPEPALAPLLQRLRQQPPADESAAPPAVDRIAPPLLAPPLLAEPDPRAPLSLADYVLVREVGVGGMGTVHEALQKSLNKPVAVKVLRKVSGTQAVERFLREACAAARLRHANIVDVHGIGRTPDGGYFLVMDLIDGPDLEERVKAGQVSLAEAPLLVAAIADAIEHAHQHGIIHRDLKPSNILVDAAGRAMVTDFGIAKVVAAGDPNQSLGDRVLGTPSYMAPEQADQRWGTIGPATDVYGLGGILYFLLTHRQPFDVEGSGGGLGMMETLARVISPEQPVPPRTLRPDVPAELEAICWKCLSKNPSDRYHSAQAVAEALRQVAATLRATKLAAGDGVVLVTPRRVVLLYKRHAQPDEALMQWLEQRLLAQGHRVFVDRNLMIGVEWAREIERQIREADAVIPLLSAGSSRSEMLAYEVNLADDAASRQTGRPKLLPVRVQFDEPLPPELAGVLDRLQAFFWQGADDNERLLAALAQAFREAAPPPAADRRWKLEPPLGAVPLDSGFYIERAADQMLQAALARRDSIVLVRGARQMGKTSLLARGLSQVRRSGVRVALTDCQKLNSTDLATAESLFLAFGEWIADKLDLDVLPHDVWNSRRGASVNFERFLRREVLGKLNGPLVWALDEVDRLFSCPFSSEVFGLFRSWHNERALDPAGPWANFTLAIAYATEAHLFITDVNQSPFNVGTRITLEDLFLDQTEELNRRYGSPLPSDDAVHRFHDLVGGQPYLVNRGLYELATRGLDLAAFERQADRDEGVFGDHLRRMLVLLATEPELGAALREFLNAATALSPSHFYRLRAAGLLAGEAAQEARLRCRLYASYLKRHLVSAAT